MRTNRFRSTATATATAAAPEGARRLPPARVAGHPGTEHTRILRDRGITRRPGRFSRGGERARVGRTDPIGEQVDPIAYRQFWRRWYDRGGAEWPGVRWKGLTLATMMQDKAAELLSAVDAQIVDGAASDQLRRDVLRMIERVDGYFASFREIFGPNPGQLISGEAISDAQWSELMRQDYETVFRHLFVGYGEEETIEDEEGSYRPPAAGDLAALATLMNQVEAVGNVSHYLDLDPDVPWWRWVFQASAAGWVNLANRLEVFVAGVDPGSPGIGSEAATVAESTEQWVEEQIDAAKSAFKSAGKGLGRLALGAGLVYLLGQVLAK